jgi:adenylate kinase
MVLRCDPDALVARVARDPRGRRDLGVELAREIQTLQEGLALTYGVVCACPVFVIDTTHLREGEVTETAMESDRRHLTTPHVSTGTCSLNCRRAHQ